MVTRRVLACLPQSSLARLSSCISPGVGGVIEAVTLAELLELRRIPAGGFVFVDPDGWHLEFVTSVAKRTADGGARLVLYSDLTTSLCRYVKAAVVGAVPPEVVMTDTYDSRRILRTLLENDTLSTPALVLAGLANPLARLTYPVGARLLSYLAWAPIPHKVQTFCEVVRLSRQVVLARLHESGLSDTAALLEVARVARACQQLKLFSCALR